MCRQYAFVLAFLQAARPRLHINAELLILLCVSTASACTCKVSFEPNRISHLVAVCNICSGFIYFIRDRQIYFVSFVI